MTPEKQDIWRIWYDKRLAVSKAYVQEIRAQTVCRQCGTQPVDFHNEEHKQFPNRRIAAMTGQGQRPERIQAEIDRCVPLCRKCHADLDGRSSLLRRIGRAVRYPTMRLCPVCSQESHKRRFRKGCCQRCYRAGLVGAA